MGRLRVIFCLDIVLRGQAGGKGSVAGVPNVTRRP